MNVIQPVVLRQVPRRAPASRLTQALRGLYHGLRPLTLPLAIWVGLGVSLYAGGPVAWMQEAAWLTWVTLREVVLGFGAFLLLFGLVQWLTTGVFVCVTAQQPRAIGLLVAILGLFVILNSLPIVVYMELMDAYGWAPFAIKVCALLTANGMLYYFFYTSFVELSHESQKLYIVSAPFKAASPANYLYEKRLWLVLATLSPLFYYLFSFTLFTDYGLQSHDTTRSIVGSLFRFLTKSEASGEQFWFYLVQPGGNNIPIRGPFSASHEIRAPLSNW